MRLESYIEVSLSPSVLLHRPHLTSKVALINTNASARLALFISLCDFSKYTSYKYTPKRTKLIIPESYIFLHLLSLFGNAPMLSSDCCRFLTYVTLALAWPIKSLIYMLSHPKTFARSRLAVYHRLRECILLEVCSKGTDSLYRLSFFEFRLGMHHIVM